MGSTSISAWEDVVRRKREARTALIAPCLETGNADRELSVDVLSINSIGDLTSRYATGELRAGDVVRRYVQR